MGSPLGEARGLTELARGLCLSLELGNKEMPISPTSLEHSQAKCWRLPSPVVVIFQRPEYFTLLLWLGSHVEWRAFAPEFQIYFK